MGRNGGEYIGQDFIKQGTLLKWIYGFLIFGRGCCTMGGIPTLPNGMHLMSM